MDKNHLTYSSGKVVSYYEKYQTLQKPEEKIVSILKNELTEMSMLDVGIGAGRTTIYFAPLVKNYTGIDYSAKMVDSCINRFKKQFSNCTFLCEDARSLSSFADGSFDFVLFSFNGIDYVSPQERVDILKQINRVLRKGGLFCFSTHNISSLMHMPFFEFRLNIPAAIKRIFEVKKIRSINKKQLELVPKADFVIINDGAHNYGLQTMYVRSDFQIEQLLKDGFSSIRIFNISEGIEITDNNKINAEKEKWLYYLCKKN